MSLAPRRVQDVVRWDEKMSKKELIQFEGPETRALTFAWMPLRGRGLHGRQDEEEPDQDSGWRSSDRRNVALRRQKGCLIFRHKDESGDGPPSALAASLTHDDISGV